jgi:predicted NBD/HSP70 family sugar kinase
LTWVSKDASLTNVMQTTQAKAPGRGVSRTLRPTTKQLPEHARRHNRSLVLQTLFHAGPSSRADLARETHLTRVTVSDLVGELIEEGLLHELGQRPGSRVGKPATLVGLNPDASHIVCLDLSDEARLIGAVLDLSGTVLQRRTMRMQGRTGEAAVAGVTELCQELIGLASRPVLGVGIGSPGVVDPDGVILQAPNLGWTDLPLAAKLAAELGLPVHVANDANTAALGEHTYGGAGGSGLMVIAIGKGVGAGLLLDGALLGGHHYAAGEIGHVIVDERGQVCACGRRGCLETVVSAPALRAAIKGLDADTADEALAAAGRRLGTALAPIVSALDLREVVLSGPADLLGGALRAAASATIRKRTMPVVGNDVDLRMTVLGEDVVLSGAAVLVLSGQLGVS